jgi:hypothetical protein
MVNVPNVKLNNGREMPLVGLVFLSIACLCLALLT